MTTIVKVLPLAILTSLTLTSCWELKESQNEPGVAYKVNRVTGEVQRIDGYSAIAVKTIASTSPEENALFNTWREIDIKSGKVKVNLKTRWIDGKVYWIMGARPFTVLKAARDSSGYASITLQLQSGEGFTLFQQPCMLSEMTRIVDGSDQPQSLQCVGSKPLSLDTYLNVKNWTSEWNF